MPLTTAPPGAGEASGEAGPLDRGVMARPLLAARCASVRGEARQQLAHAHVKRVLAERGTCIVERGGGSAPPQLLV